ncbi:MAG TPA: DUF6327 family protein [Salinimicrobium sp.]|nr:DUF6327 family protein [Salinimicrobium sp.]
MRKYSSFKEIDDTLQILKLQKEIDEEKLLLSYNQTKESMEFSPKKMIGSLFGGALSGVTSTVAKNALFLKLVTKLFNR